MIIYQKATEVHERVESGPTPKILKWSFPKGASPWKMATMLAAIVFFGFSVLWSYIDNSPPAWDPGLYLYQATILHKTFIQNGFIDFVIAVFNIDRGRVPLLPVVVQPAFYFFGPTLDAAVISLNLLAWLALAWSLPGITREATASSAKDKAGFFSFLLFGLFPLTMFVSHQYLTDLLLVAFVCASIYSLLVLHRTKKVKWSVLAGVCMGLGLLTKVTFAVFLLPAFCILVVRDIRISSFRAAVSLYLPAVLLSIAIAGPYYYYNVEQLLELTIFLSSHNLSRLYGFGGAFNGPAIREYWIKVFANPAILVAVFCAMATPFFRGGSRQNVKSMDSIVKAERNTLIIIMATWFLISFLLATFGEIKDPRYVYPGLVPIFVFTGLAAAWISASRLGMVLIVLAYMIALPGYLYSNNLISERSAGRFLSPLKMNIGLASADGPPDRRDWQADNLVRAIALKLGADQASKTVVFLGGNRYYHLRLLDYHGLINGFSLKYVVLPYYTNPSMSLDEALKFVVETPADGIIYKSGENWPPFSSRLDTAIVSRLSADLKYASTDLNIEQPDGSRFTLFFKPVQAYVFLNTISDLVGSWMAGGGLGTIAVGDGGAPTITTETGLKGSATIKDGQIYVPEWNVSGRITSDSKTIHWSNGFIWNKFSSKEP